MPVKPTEKEANFLHIAYNSFLDIYEETNNEHFWAKDEYFRLSKFRDALLIYSEILEYEPIGWFIEALKKLRPPMEAELSKDFLLFIRNVLVHFAFFKSWNDVRITKTLVNWSKPGRSIDNFLTRYAGHKEIKYRIWRAKTMEMIYFQITFPKIYLDETEILLGDFVEEKSGILFSMSLMHTVLMSQVDEISESSSRDPTFED